MPPGDHLFEHFAQHFGVNGDFDIHWGRFGNGEIEAVDQVGQYTVDEIIREEPGFVIGFLLEKAAVEIGNVTNQVFDEFVFGSLALVTARVVQPPKEKRVQSLAMEVGLRSLIRIVMPVIFEHGAQIICAPVKLEPAFMLQKGQEYQPVEKSLGVKGFLCRLPIQCN